MPWLLFQGGGNLPAPTPPPPIVIPGFSHGGTAIAALTGRAVDVDPLAGAGASFAAPGRAMADRDVAGHGTGIVGRGRKVGIE